MKNPIRRLLLAVAIAVAALTATVTVDTVTSTPTAEAISVGGCSMGFTYTRWNPSFHMITVTSDHGPIWTTGGYTYWRTFVSAGVCQTPAGYHVRLGITVQQPFYGTWYKDSITSGGVMPNVGVGIGCGTVEYISNWSLTAV